MAVPDGPLTGYLDRAARDHPVVDGLVHEGRRWQWSAVRDLVDRTAARFGDLGVGPGDRVAVVSPLAPAVLVSAFACWRLGAVVVPLDPAADRATLSDRLTRVAPTVVVVDVRSLDAIETARPGMVGCRAVLVTDPARWSRASTQVVATVAGLLGRRRRATADDDVGSLDDVLSAGPRMVRQASVEGGDVALLAWDDDRHDDLGQRDGGQRDLGQRDGREGDAPYAFSHAGLAAAAGQLREWVVELRTGREVVLSTIAPWRPGAFGTAVLPAAAVAATIVLVADSSPAAVVGAMDSEQVTLLTTSAAQVSGMVADRDLAATELTALRAALAVGGWIDPAVVRRFAAAADGVPLRLVHTRPSLAGGGLAGRIHGVPGSVLPMTDTVAAVARLGPSVLAVTEAGGAVVVPAVGDGWRRAAPDEVGLLLVAGPQRATGRWHGPDRLDPLTAGWLCTGDLAKVDDHGAFVVEGHCRDAIVRDDRRIVPAVVERALVTHPKVRSAALVVGPPGEHPAARSGRGPDRAGQATDGSWGRDRRDPTTPSAQLVAVIVTAGGRRPTVRRLRTHLRPLVGEDALPDRVVVRRELPRRPDGEPDRTAIRHSLRPGRRRSTRVTGDDQMEVGA